VRPTRIGVATGALCLLSADLLLILVTGDRSVLAFGARVGAAGFIARAAAIGVLVVTRFHLLPSRRERMDRGRLVLLLLLLPALVQFQLLGARMNGDGLSYYVFLRSMTKDRDFDLVNEYTHYGMIGRWDLRVTTKTGLRRSIYSVGPAVVWTPAFLVGEGVARAQGLLTGTMPDLSGYGRHHVNAVALCNLLYGFVALLLIHALLQRHFSPPTALLAVLLVWGATFFHWYLVNQPLYAHSPSTLVATYALWLWDRDRRATRLGGAGAWAIGWRWFFLGLILGLAMCVRWQNGVLLLLPGLDLLWDLRKDPRGLPRALGCAALLAGGVFIGAFPQMAAWKALYDMWILPCPPHGCEFVRLDHPWVLETLFSSRHGLFSWTPVFWAGYLGFLPLWRRRTALAVVFAAPLVLMTYVNLCVGDWWGGASFSNRRFDSLLPILAFGLAASIDWLLGLARRRPSLALGLAVIPFATWNLALSEQVRRGLVEPGTVASFPRLAGGAAAVLSDALGFPTTWPASWLFAWRHNLSPGRYDTLVGTYLFYRQNSLGPRLDLEKPSVTPMLDGVWGPVETVDGVAARCAFRRARVFAPLDVPEALEIRFRAASKGVATEAAVFVNGRALGRFPAGPVWGLAGIQAAAGYWRRELNEVGVEPQGGAVCVASVEFIRTPRKGRRF
jgi:hypothetical protein